MSGTDALSEKEEKFEQVWREIAPLMTYSSTFDSIWSVFISAILRINENGSLLNQMSSGSITRETVLQACIEKKVFVVNLCPGEGFIDPSKRDDFKTDKTGPDGPHMGPTEHEKQSRTQVPHRGEMAEVYRNNLSNFISHNKREEFKTVFSNLFLG